MTRAQLEHIIRAAGMIADVEDVVVIGSQAILGEFPDAPAGCWFPTRPETIRALKCAMSINFSN